MPENRSKAFLNGEGIAVPLGEVDAMLSQLWSVAGGDEPDPGTDAAAVTRVVLNNLVVADLRDAPSRIEPLLDSLVREHPSRLILLRTDPNLGNTVAAEVAASCHLPAPGRPQVCSERITLKAGTAGYRLFPGAIRPLLETDLPLVLVWSGDPRLASELLADLADESSRVILDLPDPWPDPAAAAWALDLRLTRYLREVAWFGITPWRELVAQFFDAPGCRDELNAIRRVHIEAQCATLDQPPRLALWLVAWLAGQLGWRPLSAQRDRTDHLAFRFQSEPRVVEVTCSLKQSAASLDPVILAVRIDLTQDASFLARRSRQGDCVQTVAVSCHHDGLPRLLHVPEWSLERRLAAALESARDDPPYQAALPHLLWMLANGQRG